MSEPCVDGASAEGTAARSPREKHDLVVVPGRRFASLRGELSNPLFRNAYALIVNGGLTGVLGLGFWLVAARYYRPEDVGRNAAEIQAIMFIGGLAALNYALIRFVPQAGRWTGVLVRRIYLLGSAAAAALGLGFLLTLDWWGTTFSQLARPGPALLFLASVIGWNLFTQQDGVFTGLRRSGWVPIENTVFGVVKVVLVVAFAATLPGNGIILATMLPVIIATLPVNLLIFRRLIPRHVAQTDGRHPRPSTRQIGRYLAGDYVGSLFSHAGINLIPVVVAAQLGDPTIYAYFMMAWILGAMLDLLATNMAMSLTVEGAFDTGRLAGTCRAALRRTAMLAIPMALIVALAAPFGLKVFGHGYAEHGAPLLQLLAIAALPKALIELYIGVLRVQSRTRLIAILQAVRFLGVLVPVLLYGSSLVATGWAVLLVHCVLAAALYPALWRAGARDAEEAGPSPDREDVDSVARPSVTRPESGIS